ncbi:hypothetical protein GUJ93_ZPchr0015g6992 [Zizania palustris]|uniref:Uncharacterized protein n=1 Tax=Zizania palustris TaxID=103762 RepID=A0A8J5T987_ZIZPA|nr:hypothetical protein GUJ93_ZPchr0015g6992 [Zizania palustris]
MSEADLRTDGGSEGKPCIEKTQSRSYGGKIVIVSAMSGGLCSARHGRMPAECTVFRLEIFCLLAVTNIFY